MIKLVVNADDYGIAENQTEAILAAFRRGIITSTTVMVSMPDFQRSIRRAKEEDVFGRIGLHLNFTEGIPITEPLRECSRFCNSYGTFNTHFHNSKLCRFFLTSKEQRAVALEAEAQMNVYIDAGFPLMHLDSHHHSHTDPSIARLILPIAKRLGFRSVRLSRNIPRPGYGLGKKLYKLAFNQLARRQGFKCTDYFGSCTDFDGAIATLPPDCAVELMVHPCFRTGREFDMSGKLMDMYEPMTSVEEILAKYHSKYHLVPYTEILQ